MGYYCPIISICPAIVPDNLMYCSLKLPTPRRLCSTDHNYQLVAGNSRVVFSRLNCASFKMYLNVASTIISPSPAVHFFHYI